MFFGMDRNALVVPRPASWYRRCRSRNRIRDSFLKRRGIWPNACMRWRICFWKRRSWWKREP